MTHEEKALSYYESDYHCSQAVLAAFAEELGLTEGQALRISHCFNCGMRMGEVCGACSGALMVIGMKYGQYDRSDADSDNRANDKAFTFLREFQKENGSYLCRELLGKGERVCSKMVVSAIRILEKIE